MPWAAARVAIGRSPLRSGPSGSLPPEGSPIRGGRRGRGACEVLAKGGGRAEAAAAREVVDGQVRALEQALRLEDALAQQPLQRRGAGLGAEAARERALRDAGVARQ